jgi:hypothetical protein
VITQFFSGSGLLLSVENLSVLKKISSTAENFTGQAPGSFGLVMIYLPCMPICSHTMDVSYLNGWFVE